MLIRTAGPAAEGGASARPRVSTATPRDPPISSATTLQSNTGVTSRDVMPTASSRLCADEALCAAASALQKDNAGGTMCYPDKHLRHTHLCTAAARSRSAANCAPATCKTTPIWVIMLCSVTCTGTAVCGEIAAGAVPCCAACRGKAGASGSGASTAGVRNGATSTWCDQQEDGAWGRQGWFSNNCSLSLSQACYSFSSWSCQGGHPLSR